MFGYLSEEPKGGKKKAPKNILSETDFYTLKVQSGEKDYTQEKILAAQFKHCFNQCRFLSQKLKAWKNRLMSEKRVNFCERKCCQKFEREDSRKRRKTG